MANKETRVRKSIKRVKDSKVKEKLLTDFVKTAKMYGKPKAESLRQLHIETKKAIYAERRVIPT